MIRRRTPLQRAHMTAKGPTARRRAAKRRASEREKARVYMCVDIREQFACRLTRRVHDLEHHHIRGRRGKNGGHTTDNVVLLHRDVHRDVTEHRLTITGDADGELLFVWNDGRRVRCAPGVTVFEPKEGVR